MDLLNSYVSFKVTDDHIGCGQVVEIVNEDVLSVKTPAGYTVEISKADVEQIDNEQYLEIINDLIKRIQENTGVKQMTEQEIKELQNKLTEADNKNKELSQLLESAVNDKTAVESSVTTLTEELNTHKTKVQELETKLAEIEATRLGEARFNELGAEAALLALKVEKAEDAKANLAKMSEDTYNIVKTVLAALPKSTDQTQTGLPKGTEQTQTGLPSGTSQTHASEDETNISEASTEDDETLTTASEPEVKPQEELAQAMCAVFDSRKKSKKSNKS